MKWPCPCPNIGRFREKLDDYEDISSESVKEMLKLVDCKPVRNDRSNRDKLIKGGETIPSSRPFFYLNKA